jgi:protein TonB
MAILFLLAASAALPAAGAWSCYGPAGQPAPVETSDARRGRSRAHLCTVGGFDALINGEDYPASALRAEVGNVATRVVLTIGVDGRVADCRVSRSSGNAAIDAATCRVLARRARFRPARDSNGTPVSSTVSGKLRWVMPPPIKRPLLTTD